MSPWAHNVYFQRVQDDMSKARSVCRDWEYFTPLTLDSRSGVVSTEDTDEIWNLEGDEGGSDEEGQRKGEQASRDGLTRGLGRGGGKVFLVQ